MAITQSSLPRLLDLAGVAEHLGVTTRHVRQLVAERRIPYIKWGRLLRFDPAEVAEWLDAQRRTPTHDHRPVAGHGWPASRR